MMNSEWPNYLYLNRLIDSLKEIFCHVIPKKRFREQHLYCYICAAECVLLFMCFLGIDEQKCISINQILYL